MIKTWLRFGGVAALTAALGLGRAADAGTEKVYSINPTPGDSYSGGGPDVTIGQGWSYTNRSAEATIGINNTFLDNSGGNGSVYIQTKNQPGGAYLTHRFASDNLKQFTDLTSLSYDWMIGSIDASYPGSVAFKILVSVAGVEGAIVWEPAENGLAAHPADGWQTSDVLANSGGAASIWTDSPDLMTYLAGLSGSGVPKLMYGRYWGSLTQWNTAFNDAKITGFQAGLGPNGYDVNIVTAVDNITFGFGGGEATTYDFEVRPTPAVPEPGSIALSLIAGGLGLAGAAWRRRRRVG